MTTEVEFQKFLEKAIWDKTWEEEDEDGEIVSYEVLTFEEAGMLTNDNGLVVVSPDRSAFTVTIQRKVW